MQNRHRLSCYVIVREACVFLVCLRKINLLFWTFFNLNRFHSYLQKCVLFFKCLPHCFVTTTFGFLAGRLHVWRRSQRRHLHSWAACPRVCQCGSTFLSSRDQWRTVSGRLPALSRFPAHLRCLLNVSLFSVCRFIKGLPVKDSLLPEDLVKAIGLEPMPKGISYVISTKVKQYPAFYLQKTSFNIMKDDGDF